MLLSALIALGGCSDSDGGLSGLGADGGNNGDATGQPDVGSSDTGGADAAPDTAPDIPEALCEQGESRCIDVQTQETCDDPATGFVANPCPEGLYCLADVCEEPACTPGPATCLTPATLQECTLVEDVPTLVTEDCAEEEVCFEGSCQPQVCDPNTGPTCLDTATEIVCDAPGIAQRVRF